MDLHSASYPEKEVFPLSMGEDAAFERIFKLYHAPLRYYCEQLTGAGEESEDIVCEIFLTLWKKQIRFESVEHTQAFLYRSARNACLNFIRNGNKAIEKKEKLSAETTELSEDFLNTIIRTEVWAELYRAVEKLPSQCCKVITLSYLEGMTNQEIADEMNLSLQTVKNYKLRGLSLLKDKLPDGILVLLFATMLLK
jgi:RNA polymerase sigma-70 factor (family 1)